MSTGSAVETAALVGRRQISPIELVDDALARIERLNPHLNAFVHVDADCARAAARAAEQALMRGEAPGPLHGVPMSVKSSIDVAGLRCECGTRLRAGHVASSDAPLVARLRRAGAIIVGNTNVPEFLMAWETDNALYGRTRSPWDPARTPGGSSGGEAAAIAAGCVLGGIGSDGGGSIRVPAHFSGICGLKPTPGRVPGTGHYLPCVGPFSLLGVVGPMARTVDDLEVILRAIAGADDGDPCAAPVPLPSSTTVSVADLRVGWFEDDGITPVTSEIRDAVRTAVAVLREAGAATEEFRPAELEAARRAWWTIFVRLGSALLAELTAGHEMESHPILRELIALGQEEPPLTAMDVTDAWVQRDELRARLLSHMRRYPILLCPVAAIPAFRHGEREWRVDGATVRYLAREGPNAWAYTQWFNLLGNPAASVPAGRTADGLPVGVQVVGRPWEEHIVLAVAREIERACGGFVPPAIA